MYKRQANILAHNRDLEGVRTYLEELRGLRPDGLIIADPGIFEIAKEVCPEIERHISTQANNTNYATCRFWYGQGASRIVTARELSLEEIKEIREHIPEDMELETFIHGAMCISYSGRCLLSNYLTGRDANQGACTHQMCIRDRGKELEKDEAIDLVIGNNRKKDLIMILKEYEAGLGKHLHRRCV